MTKKQNKLSEEYYESSVKPFAVSYIPEKIGTYYIEITDAIRSPEQFEDAIKILGIADERNDVTINLQCPGGNLDATDALIHAMKKCEADIHVVATGGCHSAATLILLEADSFELSGGFNSLIHCGSTGSIGNYNEFTAHTKFSVEFLAKTFRGYYEGFLTDSELDSLLEGKDIWVDAQGWVDRYTMRHEYFKAKHEAMNKPAKKPRTKKPKQFVALEN